MWRPHAGPQTEFLAAQEDEVLYGGAAGGGKSDALLAGGLIPMQSSVGTSLILRRTFPELAELIERAKRWFAPAGAEWHDRDKVFRFPGGGLYYFGYGVTLREIEQYTGKEYDFIGYDEIGLMADEAPWELLTSRLRTKDPRLTPMARATANPGGPGHAWLKRRFILPTEYGRSIVRVEDEETGEVITRRFIPAKVKDNPTLIKNNPKYVARLRALSEVRRKQLLEGDWDAASGMYFEKLTRVTHMIPAFDIPASWAMWGAYDWGYAHPAVFGKFAMDHEGNTYLVDSIHMHRKTDEEMADRLLAEKDHARYTQEVHAGHDCWDEIRARGSKVPSTNETFYERGITLCKANTSRVPGWRNMREWIEPRGEKMEPAFFLLDTPGNQQTLDCLTNLVSDEKDPEDVLKVDANPTTGVGGDDAADMTRYGLAARIYAPVAPKVIDTSIYRDRDSTPDEAIYGIPDPDEGSDFGGLPAGF